MLTCVGRGWPAPTIKWLNGDGNQLTTSYIIKGDTVMADLHLDSNESYSQLQCQVMNVHDTQRLRIQMIRGRDYGVPPLTPLEPEPSEHIQFRLQLQSIYCSNWNVSIVALWKHAFINFFTYSSLQEDKK